MSKQNNLSDFLAALADKFRNILGTYVPLNPQDFEDRLQDVYNKGYWDGGPTGVTAVDGDVLAGKVYGSGGNGKSTGTMPNLGAAQSTTGVFEEDSALAVGTPLGGYTGTDATHGTAVVRAAKNDVAAAIGLTADKLLAGSRVLGVTGIGEKIVAVYAMAAGAWTGPIVYASAQKTDIDTSILDGNLVKKAGRFQVVRLSGGDTSNWTTWPALSRGVGTHTLKVGDTITVKTTGEAQNGYMPICLFYVVYLGA